MRAAWSARSSGDARQPCAMSSISTSSGEGSSRSSLRPDSMRCQARVRRLWSFGHCARTFLAELVAGGVAVTDHQMVVDHADRLHERVDDGRADEVETVAEQLFRHGA